MSISAAVGAGILGTNIVYGYNPAPVSQYFQLQPDTTSHMDPFVGYWVFSAMEGASLVFSAPATPNAQIVSPTVSSGLF